MKKICDKGFRNFLNSNLDEVDYFRCDCDKESLISLRDYLEELKLVDSKYRKNIKEPLESIIAKNRWVKIVGTNDPGELCIYGKNGPWVSVNINEDTGFYQCVGELVMGLGIRNYLRRNIVTNSREELIEIGRIAEKFFKDYYYVVSVSERFELKNNYWYSFLKCNDFYLFDIDRETFVPDSYSWQFKDYLTMEDKKKLLKKIQIKR